MRLMGNKLQKFFLKISAIMDFWVEWGETGVNQLFHEVQLICFQNIYSLYMFLGKLLSYIGSKHWN